MRVFLSAYSTFTLAIPMDAVASMVLYKQKTEKLVQYDPGNRSTFISLPWLFNMPDEPVPHGVVLREMNSKVNKVVLLTAEVKRDIEIPDEEFKPIPKALDTLRFSEIFSGIKFSGNPILLLNVEKLLQVIQDDQLRTDKKPNPPKQPVPAVPEPSPPTPNKIIEKPVIKEPPIEEPVIEKPAIEEPLIEEPVIEEAPIEEPVVEETPIEEPPIEEPIIEEPLIEEPLIEESVIEEAPIEKPIVEETPIEKPPIEESPIEEPPPSLVEAAETSEPFSLALAEVLEICEIFEEPQTSPVEAPADPYPSTPNEIIEVCDVIEEPPINPAETSEPFSLAFAEVLEICDLFEEPPTSPAVIVEISEPTPPTPEPQPSPQGVEPEVRVSPLDEVLELSEI
jgi:hypothetical protein